MANINLINVDKKYKPSHMEKQRDGMGEGGRQAGRDRTNAKLSHVIVFPSTFVLVDVILAGKNCAVLTGSVCVMNWKERKRETRKRRSNSRSTCTSCIRTL